MSESEALLGCEPFVSIAIHHAWRSPFGRLRVSFNDGSILRFFKRLGSEKETLARASDVVLT